MTPLPGRHSEPVIRCGPPFTFLPDSGTSLPLKEPPICRTSAAGLTLSLEIDHSVGPPRTRIARDFLSAPGWLSGDPRPGRDPVLGSPRERKPLHLYLLGVEEEAGGVGGISREPLASFCS
ncbi:hypothetical protein VZT92_020276 [Zoarces viviparus]|uniref:Uncharacterized protein n=1 Tax=Zoarces viviparus TaxID=48416 RepID=A0AAW1EDY6_ZOAVI